MCVCVCVCVCVWMCSIKVLNRYCVTKHKKEEHLNRYQILANLGKVGGGGGLYYITKL